MNNHNIFLKHICECRDLFFNDSPFHEKVSINENSDESISFIFCGQKPFGFKPMKNRSSFIIKNDYYKNLELDTLGIYYEISYVKSLPDFTRISIETEFESFKILTDYIFKFSEQYVDEHYIPEYTYDCCHRYMECSDEKRCTNPNYLHSKGCNYNNNNLSKGRIFFGKNRNI